MGVVRRASTVGVVLGACGFRSGVESSLADASRATADALSTPYRDAVLASSPVAYWRVDERSGSLVHDIGRTPGTYNGTYMGMPTLGVPGALASETDPAASFDGSDGLFSVPDAAPLRLNGSWSLELWMKLVTSPTDFPALVSKGNSDAGGTGWLVYYHAPSVDCPLGPPCTLKPTFKQAGTDELITMSGALETDRYHYYVLTYDGIVQWYVDGALDIAYTQYPNILVESLDTSPVEFASSANAVLDEIAVYERALSAAEINTHFEAAQ
jgi:trimeric autotransporter adhesin